MRRQMKACVLSILLGCLCSASAGPFGDRELGNKIRNLVPTLGELEKKSAQDAEALMGLAATYRSFPPAEEYFDRSLTLYRQAALLAPQDKAIHAGLSEDMVTHFCSRRENLLADLEAKRAYAVRNNLREVEMLPWGKLYHELKEEGQEKVMIRDFNETRLKLLAKVDRDLPNVRAVLEQGRELDPQNAYYDYLEAFLELELGNDTQGLAKAKRGSEKPQLNYYHNEVKHAVDRALKETTLGESDRNTLVGAFPRVGTPPHDRLSDRAWQFEAGGKPDKAREIYETQLRMVRQIREEPSMKHANAADVDTLDVDRCETEATKNLARVREREKNNRQLQ